ncbi:GNAT family N-acetyltransferase [Pseudoxanthomonas suwonensis]|uniref:GNAT family acetyltransferase n=1 Tax=Pseudoxanthomonas suwonensis TaxID=314722 RepID=A0A0E3YZG8_9GAMM|nr:GNAT family N-acetyltransferase [Pseudoxanthomonas suwonensis]AKC85484.1 GNAT family acetyltransferase [Pseudoxanthomonas suwonensis]
MTATLVLPGRGYERSYRGYILELGDEERYPFPLDFEYRDFAALLRRLDEFANGIDIPEGFVPSSTYWLVEGGEIVGVSNLRHRLNERIRQCGGHIGLGIRPSRRGRGFGNALMALTIREARKRGIEDVHIHCHKGNEASARMIVRNGGVLDSEIEDGEPAGIVQRYVVAPGMP